MREHPRKVTNRQGFLKERRNLEVSGFLNEAGRRGIVRGPSAITTEGKSRLLTITSTSRHDICYYFYSTRIVGQKAVNTRSVSSQSTVTRSVSGRSTDDRPTSFSFLWKVRIEHRDMWPSCDHFDFFNQCLMAQDGYIHVLYLYPSFPLSSPV